MAKPASKTVKKRKLREASETMRERAERVAPTGQTSNSNRTNRRIGGLPVWKPFKFIGRYIIPPYFRSSWREVRQVTWPNRKQSLQLTEAVIIFAVVFGVLVAVFDYGLDKLFKEVILK